jgi:hypothetical protein
MLLAQPVAQLRKPKDDVIGEVVNINRSASRLPPAAPQ